MYIFSIQKEKGKRSYINNINNCCTVHSHPSTLKFIYAFLNLDLSSAHLSSSPPEAGEVDLDADGEVPPEVGGGEDPGGGA